MGRARSLPAFLGKIHPEFKTPVNAIWLQTALTLALGLGMGFWIGPDQEYYFLGVSMTLGLIFVYAAGNIGVMVDYGWRRRDQLHPILHVAFPLLSTLALLWAGYFSVVPLPPPPVRYAPYLAGVWLLAGVFLAFRPHRSERL
jgi:amino acid transporter